MYEQIREEIKNAAAQQQKVAMLHLQVLLHADQLKEIDAHSFCRSVGLPSSYMSEYSKMLGLARLIEKHGMRISPASAADKLAA